MKPEVTGLIGAIGGAVLGTFITMAVIGNNDARSPAGTPGNLSSETETGKPDDGPLNGRNDGVAADTEQAAEIQRLKAKLADAETERDTERGKLTRLETESKTTIDGLNARIAELESQANAPAANNIKVAWGKWAEERGLREADWNRVGSTYREMTELVREIAVAVHSGQDVDPAKTRRAGELNRVLVEHYGPIIGKLPSNAAMNGEFAHPFNAVNILAAQLESANMPLSEDQKAALIKLGEEYDRKWNEVNARYTDATFELEKQLDEADLLEWFRAEMFKVTDERQRRIASPPESEGYIRMDLYGASLIFVYGPGHVPAATREELLEMLKGRFTEHFKIPRDQIDAAAFAFEAWLDGLGAQIGPRAAREMAVLKTREVMVSGRAQLALMKELHGKYVTDEKIRDSIRDEGYIFVPYLTMPE